MEIDSNEPTSAKVKIESQGEIMEVMEPIGNNAAVVERLNVEAEAGEVNVMEHI